MRRCRSSEWMWIPVLLLGIVTAGRGDKLGKAGRRLLVERGPCVVNVALVIEMSMNMGGGGSGMSEEMKGEATATFLDPSGLAVVPLSDIDPASLFGQLMGGKGDGMMSKMKWESQVKDIKIRLHDEREIPAEIILRDRDLNLAFVRPKPPFEEKVDWIDFSEGADPSILDQLICLDRMGKVANWELGISLCRISCKVVKPRLLYVPTQLGNIGCPVFTGKGQIVGLALMRHMGGEGSSLLGMMGSLGGQGNMGLLPIILPAKDIAEVANQALEAAEGLDEGSSG